MKKLFVLISLLALMACQSQPPKVNNVKKSNKVTQQDAADFLETVEESYLKEYEYAARVAWVQANFITDDTIWLGAKSIEKMGALQVKFANQAKKFDNLNFVD